MKNIRPSKLVVTVTQIKAVSNSKNTRKLRVSVKALRPRKPVVTIVNYRNNWKMGGKLTITKELLKFHFRQR